jgi:hypothetical protein
MGSARKNAESALIVVVPEAEPLVAPLRLRFDPSAAAGVPADITVLYPFLAPDTIDQEVLATLGRCFAGFPPIAFQLAELRRFDGEALYLAPDPDEPFRQLTLAAWRLFPEHPPYDGRWPQIVPHLSVAQPKQDSDNIVAEVGAAARDGLPIKAATKEVVLIENTNGRWTQRAKFRLGS